MPSNAANPPRKRRLSKTKSADVAEAEAAAATDDVEPKENLEGAFKLLDEVEEAWVPEETGVLWCFIVCCFFVIKCPGQRRHVIAWGEGVVPEVNLNVV